MPPSDQRAASSVRRPDRPVPPVEKPGRNRRWTLVEADDDKDFNRYFLGQPEHNAWQPTRKLFNELSGYNRDAHRRIE